MIQKLQYLYVHCDLKKMYHLDDMTRYISDVRYSACTVIKKTWLYAFSRPGKVLEKKFNFTSSVNMRFKHDILILHNIRADIQSLMYDHNFSFR